MASRYHYNEAYLDSYESLVMAESEELFQVLAVDPIGGQIRWIYITKEVKNDRRVSSQRSKASGVDSK